MALRKLRYEKDEILRKKCREVVQVDGRIRDLLQDMMDTLHSVPGGAALAACQVGILKRLVVIDMPGVELKLVNPRIISNDGVQRSTEGCLSIPDKVGITLRPQRVTVQALDEYGQEVVLTGEGQLAKCFCHELDHLDGILFIDIIQPDASCDKEGSAE